MIPREFTKGLPNSTKEEMNTIAAEAVKGDMQARHDLGELMQPFVINYVRTIKGDYSRDQRNEITQAAWLGVAEALDRWDVTKDVKFNTYAHFWIRGEVNKWLAQNSGVLALPRTAWVDAGKVEAIVREKYGEEVPATEIPDALLAAMEITVGDDSPRRFASAGAAFRARQAPFITDPDWEPSTSYSAEDHFFDDTHDLDTELLDILDLCTMLYENGDEAKALEVVGLLINKYELPPEVGGNILRQARQA